MTDATETLCKQIRQVLARPDAFTRDHLVALARRYAEQVHAVNERLDLAHRWLRQGLRSEALGLVEQSPDALDAAAQLCLGYAWNQWTELCRRNEVQDVPCPDLEAATGLSDAYDRETLLHEHLARHRTLALANAPLSERLDVLEVLARCDPDNPIWLDQRRSLEADRLGQISLEARSAVAAKDLPRLQRLHSELRQRQWLSPPPPALQDSIARATRDLHRARALAEYERLARELHDAHGAQDEDMIGRLAASWEDLRERSGVEPPDAVAAEVKPVLSWWREREAARQAELQFRSDLARMEQLLDEQAPMRDLEPLYARLGRAEREIPRHIVARYQSRRDEYLRQRRFRMRLAAASVSGLLIVAAATIGWWISEYGRQKRLDEWVGQLTAAVDAGDLERATRLLEEVRRNQPNLWTAAPIVALRSELERLHKEDAVRRAQLAATLEEIEASDPLDPSLDGKLKQARLLARSEEERLRVARLRERIARARREHQQSLDADFRRIVAALNEESRRILAADIDAREKAARLAGLVSRYEAALRNARVSDEVLTAAREQLATLRSDLEQRRQRLQRAEQAANALSELWSKYGDLAAYEQAARAFVDAFPERPEAKVLDSVLKDAPAWHALRPWNELMKAWQAEGLLRRPETAADFAARLRSLPPELTSLIGEAALSDLSAYFARAAAALNPEDSGIARIIRTFEQPWMRNLQYVLSGDGRPLYYVLDGRLKQASSSPPTYQVSGVVLTPEALLLAEERETRIIRDVQNPRLDKAEICSFAEQQTEKLRRLQPGGWRTIHLELTRAVAAYPGIDPVLRLQLARTFLQWHMREGWPPPRDDGQIAQFLKKIDQTLFGQWKLDEVPWLAPERSRPSVRKARQAAERLLAELPDVQNLIRESQAALRELQTRCRPWQPVGVVWSDQEGRPAIRGTVPQGLFGTLRQEEGGEPAFRICGERKREGVSFREGRVPTFGTPVFAPPPWSLTNPQDEDS